MEDQVAVKCTVINEIDQSLPAFEDNLNRKGGQKGVDQKTERLNQAKENENEAAQKGDMTLSMMFFLRIV